MLLPAGATQRSTVHRPHRPWQRGLMCSIKRSGLTHPAPRVTTKNHEQLGALYQYTVPLRWGEQPSLPIRAQLMWVFADLRCEVHAQLQRKYNIERRAKYVYIMNVYFSDLSLHRLLHPNQE